MAFSWRLRKKDGDVNIEVQFRRSISTLRIEINHSNCSLRVSCEPSRLSSAGKESTCNARDPSSIPGSRRSIGERIGYPLQHSWASLVAQLVKNLPAMQETWVQSLGWEDLLEKGKATHSSILAWRIPWTV